MDNLGFIEPLFGLRRGAILGIGNFPIVGVWVWFPGIRYGHSPILSDTMGA